MHHRWFFFLSFGFDNALGTSALRVAFDAHSQCYELKNNERFGLRLCSWRRQWVVGSAFNLHCGARSGFWTSWSSFLGLFS